MVHQSGWASSVRLHRGRKALESRSIADDERITVLENQVAGARALAEDADTKYDEVTAWLLIGWMCACVAMPQSLIIASHGPADNSNHLYIELSRGRPVSLVASLLVTSHYPGPVVSVCTEFSLFMIHHTHHHTLLFSCSHSDSPCQWPHSGSSDLHWIYAWVGSCQSIHCWFHYGLVSESEEGKFWRAGILAMRSALNNWKKSSSRHVSSARMPTANLKRWLHDLDLRPSFFRW